jgi:hypothetical protein
VTISDQGLIDLHASANALARDLSDALSAARTLRDRAEAAATRGLRDDDRAVITAARATIAGVSYRLPGLAHEAGAAILRLSETGEK